MMDRISEGNDFRVFVSKKPYNDKAHDFYEKIINFLLEFEYVTIFL